MCTWMKRSAPSLNDSNRSVLCEYVGFDDHSFLVFKNNKVYRRKHVTVNELEPLKLRSLPGTIQDHISKTLEARPPHNEGKCQPCVSQHNPSTTPLEAETPFSTSQSPPDSSRSIIDIARDDITSEFKRISSDSSDDDDPHLMTRMTFLATTHGLFVLGIGQLLSKIPWTNSSKLLTTLDVDALMSTLASFGYAMFNTSTASIPIPLSQGSTFWSSI